MPVTRAWQRDLDIADARRMQGLADQLHREDNGKAFDLDYSPSEILAKTVELFRAQPICSHCARRVAAPDHATAMRRNRDDQWLLVHHPMCAINAIAEENDLLLEAAQERRAG